MPNNSLISAFFFCFFLRKSVLCTVCTQCWRKHVENSLKIWESQKKQSILFEILSNVPKKVKARQHLQRKQPSFLACCSDKVFLTKESCHMWMGRVTCEWVMSRANGTCQLWMSHVTYECDIWMSHIWMSHVTYKWVMSHVWMSYVTHKNHVTYEYLPAVYESCIWISHVSHMNESCHMTKSWNT